MSWRVHDGNVMESAGQKCRGVHDGNVMESA